MSERLEFKGDYMGFTYNNTHSSSLGIVRTSDGSRFNENLLPTIQDKTVQVPGGDGTYFFGSYFTQRQFSVPFAFDSLTEEQIRRIKEVFGDKQIHDLIFDEAPYKVYSAKVTGTATIKYIPFAEGATNRVYKGEGTIQFTCYYPFARCRFTTLEECKGYSNWEEWIEASRIATYDESTEQYVLNTGNFGDIPVPFKLSISGADAIKIIEVKDGNNKLTTLDWSKLPEDKSGTINTKTGLVLSDSGEILNKYVSGDLTAKIPVGENVDGAQFVCLYI